MGKLKFINGAISSYFQISDKSFKYLVDCYTENNIFEYNKNE